MSLENQHIRFFSEKGVFIITSGIYCYWFKYQIVQQLLHAHHMEHPAPCYRHVRILTIPHEPYIKSVETFRNNNQMK